MTQFKELLGSDNPLLKSLNDRGFEVPTEIQEKSIPSILEGKDVIAGASTGSGKTLAFSTGIIKNVERDKGIQALVLTPTRELAEQITKEVEDFSKYKKLKVVVVYGGVGIYNQVQKLKKAEVVIATPGRILDHLGRETIDLTRVNTLVLDEADRMLDMGFREDVEKIVSKCNENRQTLLYSATINHDVAKLANKFMNNPIEISAAPNVDPKKLKQIYYDVPDQMKYSLLIHLLKNEKAELVMIFCNTRMNVDFVTNNLSRLGIEAVPIHGGFTQDKRNRMLSEFHSKSVHVLVATDVAARGLDIKGVSHVYNYDIPMSSDEYVHRIGRTARAGKEGKVINILASRDYEKFSIIKQDDFPLKQVEMPEVERIPIAWMPERRGRFGGRSGDRGNGRFSGRGNERSSGGGNGRFGRRNDNSRGRFSGSRNGNGRRSDRSENREGSKGRFSGRRNDSSRNNSFKKRVAPRIRSR